MKKLVLLLAVVFGMSMISCTEKAAEQTTETVDSAIEVVDSAAKAAVDTAAQKMDSLAGAAAEKVEGAVEEAKK